jgi:hypothetical protein
MVFEDSVARHDGSGSYLSDDGLLRRLTKTCRLAPLAA